MRASTMLQNDPLKGAVCRRCATLILPGERFVPSPSGVADEQADWSRVAHLACEDLAAESAAAALLQQAASDDEAA